MSEWPAASSVLMVLLLALASSSVSRGQPVVGRSQVRFLGRADSCKTVSIPALDVCGPGLVCSPRTGTCVPVPASYQFLKMNSSLRAEKRDSSQSAVTHNKWRQRQPHQAEEKLFAAAWSFNKIQVAP